MRVGARNRERAAERRRRRGASRGAPAAAAVPVLALVLVLVLVLALALAGRPARVWAAGEWRHASPRGWVIGLDEARWPGRLLAGSAVGAVTGGDAAVRWGAPWGWPGVGAVAVTGGYAAPGWRVAGGMAEVRSAEESGGFREVRWVAGAAAEIVPGQRLAATWSVLDLALEEIRCGGHELALGWSVRRSPWRAMVVALGAWRSPGAARLGSSRELVAAVGGEAPPLAVDIQWRDSAAGSVVRAAGAVRMAAGAIELRAAVASAVPHLRLGLGLRRRRLVLDLAYILHPELPPTRVIALGVGGRSDDDGSHPGDR